MEIIGAPIGDKDFCSDFVAQKRANASKLLAQMEQVGSTDSQVALLLLGLCGGFCKLVHISRSTPPSLISDALSVFDTDVRRCFTESTAIDTSQSAWQQVKLSQSRGGLGLRQLSKHSMAAYLASLSSSGLGSSSATHLQEAISHYNSLVPELDALNVDSFLKTVCSQRTLSGKTEERQFSELHTCSLFHPPMHLPGCQLYHLWELTHPLSH